MKFEIEEGLLLYKGSCKALSRKLEFMTGVARVATYDSDKFAAIYMQDGTLLLATKLSNKNKLVKVELHKGCTFEGLKAVTKTCWGRYHINKDTGRVEKSPDKVITKWVFVMNENGIMHNILLSSFFGGSTSEKIFRKRTTTEVLMTITPV